MRKLWPGVLAVVAAGVFGIVMHDRLPEQVATHWNLNGEPDGWSSRTVAVAMLPALGLLLAAFLTVAPKIDPKRKNFALHENSWWLLANAVLVFLAGLHVIALGSALGWPIPFNKALGLGLGAMMVILGNYITRVRQNWFLGIRTPWSLSSERSWRETHRIGGRLMALGGLVLVIISLVMGRVPGWILLACLGVPALVAVMVSYMVWKNDPEAGGVAR